MNGLEEEGALAVTTRATHLNDLAPDPRNPRTILPDNARRLETSLRNFGDLGGIVFNRRLGLIVGGHQRQRFIGEGVVTLTQVFQAPTEQGTTAVGFIEADGERWAYREVDWDDTTHRLANIAANNPNLQGKFDFKPLADAAAEIEGSGEDFTRSGFDRAETEKLVTWTPEQEAPGVDEMLVKDPSSTVVSYLTGVVKQLVFSFANEEYGAVVEKLERIGQAHGLVSNTMIFLHVLNHYEACVGLDA